MTGRILSRMDSKGGELKYLRFGLQKIGTVGGREDLGIRLFHNLDNFEGIGRMYPPPDKNGTGWASSELDSNLFFGGNCDYYSA